MFQFERGKYMYNDERKGFTAKDILIQLLFIILFVFIMVWLFPTKSSINLISDKLDILTGTIFNTNIQNMKTAAVSYYTTERLPKAVNDVEKMTLQQMLDKKLLVDFVDGNGKACDATASYVEVIKLDDEYQMKVNLSCSDNDAYIIVHLGCYDYCKASGVCTKEEKVKVVENKPTPTPTPTPVVTCQYEYLKVTDGKWGEFGEWSSWSTTKADETDYRRVEMKTEKVATGKEEVKGSKVETVDATATTSSYCPSGYTKNGSTCSRVATGYYNAKCPVGYTLNGDGTCSGTVSTTTKYSPSCPSGYTRSGATCYKVNSSSISVAATCPSGYTLSGSTCTKTTTTSGTTTCTKGAYVTTLTGTSVPANNNSYIYETVSSDYVYKCNDQCAFRWEYTYKKYKANCTTTGGTSSTQTANPTCPSGYTGPSNGRCYKTTSSTDSVAATCNNGGYLSGDVCYVSGSRVNVVTATCPTGFNLTGNRCYGTKTVTTNLVTTTSYSCKEGYTLSGNKCTRTVQTSEWVTKYENVKYYRYKTRTYISGTRLVEWSKSQNDTYLISQGYKLTGNKKCA